MKDILGLLQDIRRPRLLIRAARLGAEEYRRDRHLQRLLGYGSLPRSAVALLRLIEIEREMNDQRREADAGYSLSRHLDVLIAMVGEANILKATRTNPVT